MVRRTLTHGGQPSRARPDERGETLIESLVTILLLGLAVVGLLAGFVTVARLTDQNDRTTHAANYAQSFAEQLKQPVSDDVAAMEYRPCGEAGAGDYQLVGDELIGDVSYDEVDVEVQFASSLPSSGGGTVSWSSTCPGEDLGLQLVTVEVTVRRGDDGEPFTETLSVIKRNARCEDQYEEYENTDQGPC